MDELDILLLAERDLDGAKALARLHGFVALEARLDGEEPSRSVFAYIRDARLSVNESAAAARISRATAQAAAVGRIPGHLTGWEKRHLLVYLYARREALNAAIEACERKRAKDER